MLPESIPTSAAPDATRNLAAASVRKGRLSKYRAVIQYRDQPVSTRTALPAKPSASGKSGFSIAGLPFAEILKPARFARRLSLICDKSFSSAYRWKGESRYVAVLAT